MTLPKPMQELSNMWEGVGTVREEPGNFEYLPELGSQLKGQEGV